MPGRSGPTWWSLQNRGSPRPRSRAKRGYLAFAIGLHAIFDMPAALYQFGYVKQLFPVELWLAVCALYALRSARKCYLEECDA